MATLEQLRSLDEAVQAWDQRGWPRPDVALVSGSGLAVDLHRATHGPLALGDLLPFPVHAVAGHPLETEILVPRPGRTVAYFRGRLHSYQGYGPFETVFPVRLAARLGAGTLVMTNAAGGLTGNHPPGSMVAVEDQINLTGLNPLRGKLPEEWGPRFPDMAEAYDPGLRRLARETADELGLTLGSGVYAGLAGPSYETPAEVRMLAGMGAELVGMSTVLEVIAARHMGLRCLVISLVSNLGAGVADEPLSHDEVLEAARTSAAQLRRLLGGLLEKEELTAHGRASA